MMELADVLDSKSSGSDTVRVRPPLPAPKRGQPEGCPLFLLETGLVGFDNSACRVKMVHTPPTLVKIRGI